MARRKRTALTVYGRDRSDAGHSDVVSTALDLATRGIAPPAKIPNYLPVLVERDVRTRLARYLQG